MRKRDVFASPARRCDERGFIGDWTKTSRSLNCPIVWPSECCPTAATMWGLSGGGASGDGRTFFREVLPPSSMTSFFFLWSTVQIF
jgi:hypothetical protein